MLIRIIRATVIAFVCTNAQAEYLLGSVGFSTHVNPGSGTLTHPITFLNVQTNASNSGFPGGFPANTAWGNFQLNAPSAETQVISISEPGFGDFTGTMITDTGEYTLGTRFSAAVKRDVTVTANGPRQQSVFWCRQWWLSCRTHNRTDSKSPAISLDRQHGHQCCHYTADIW